MMNQEQIKLMEEELRWANTEIGRLRENIVAMRDLLPDPVAESGWDDPMADENVHAELALLAVHKDTPVRQWPNHIRNAWERINSGPVYNGLTVERQSEP